MDCRSVLVVGCRRREVKSLIANGEFDFAVRSLSEARARVPR